MKWFTKIAVTDPSLLPGEPSQYLQETSIKDDIALALSKPELRNMGQPDPQAQAEAEKMWQNFVKLTQGSSEKILPHITELNNRMRELDKLDVSHPDTAHGWRRWGTDVENTLMTEEMTADLGDISWDDPEVTQTEPEPKETDWFGEFTASRGQAMTKIATAWYNKMLEVKEISGEEADVWMCGEEVAVAPRSEAKYRAGLGCNKLTSSEEQSKMAFIDDSHWKTAGAETKKCMHCNALINAKEQSCPACKKHLGY
jgi:hypothetical protein